MVLKCWSISGSLSNVHMKKAALHAAGLTVTPEMEKVRTCLSSVCIIRATVNPNPTPDCAFKDEQL